MDHPHTNPMMRRAVRTAGLILTLFLVAACGSASSENGESDGDRSCLPGREGCACDDGGCQDGLVCGEDDLCHAAECPLGEEGCACFDNGTCSFASSGIRLLCVDDICRMPDCEAGQEGCPCSVQSDCSEGLECRNRVCASSACPAGSLGCACRAEDECDEELACRNDVCVDPGCVPGEIGCLCRDDACSDEKAFCDEDGYCRAIECPAGTEGCPCASDQRCGYNTRGEELVCEGGTCASPSCAPGSTGCVCLNAFSCTSGQDSCQSGFCQPASCIAGEINCACAGGSCNPGLVCRDGALCVDGVGYIGGACRADETCVRGARCQDGQCVYCALGSVGCACRDDGGCSSGLECRTNLCWVSENGEPPENPSCYTPCNRGMNEEDGGYRDCPADGLMPGCLSGQECREGTCAPADGNPDNACTRQTDCPSYQACIQGVCYSNCDSDTECPADRSCHRHVCRRVCGMEGSECPTGYSCVSEDGESGYCLPVAEAAGVPAQHSDSVFGLSLNRFELTNIATSGELVVTNNSASYQRVLFRKQSHTLYHSDGSSESRLDPYDDGTECAADLDCPLPWLEMGEKGSLSKVQDFEILLEPNGGQATVAFGLAGEASAVRWDGRIEAIASQSRQTIVLSYSEIPEGRWQGNLYYFAQFGDHKLEEWQADRENLTLLSQVGNAFVQRWGAFRNGNISWEEFQSVLSATQTESWRWPNVTQDCPAEDGACYMYDINDLGLVIFTSDLASNPIPTGVTEMPFAMNLTQAGEDHRMFGRIESQKSLQYAGNPAVNLTFSGSPMECDSTVGHTCLALLDSLDADIYLGGRYETDSTDEACTKRQDSGYYLYHVPWLLKDFTRKTEANPLTSQTYRYECLDSQIPFNDGSGEISEEVALLNGSLSAANPIPNGRTLRRHIKLVDGALINQSMLFAIFEEKFDSFLPERTEPFSAYGFMLLKREPTELAKDDLNANQVLDVYEGSVLTDDRPEPENVLAVACSEDLIHHVLGSGTDAVDADNAGDLVWALIDGVIPDESPQFIDAGCTERVHYLCVDNGLFDGGKGAVTDVFGGTSLPNDNRCGLSGSETNYYDGNGSCDDGGPDSATSICPLGTDYTDCGTRHPFDVDIRVACPLESEVIYFTVDAGKMSQSDIAHHACQDTGSCQTTLNEWAKHNDPLIHYKPAWRCTNPNEVYCDGDRLDLRNGKSFYQISQTQAKFSPLYAVIDSAFRYKTRFRNRAGENIGFAPQTCLPDSNQIPYCYEPADIEETRARVDCLLEIWDGFYPSLDAPTRARLDEYLCSNFSYTEACRSGMNQEIIHDGFERLYAELLVTMGDESYTRAFASRFDLANAGTISFPGEEFETGGINLSGVAGYELYNLYKAVEYYQEALDRFYTMSPLIWKSLSYGSADRNFVTLESVIYYFERLVRASTQKARVWSQTATRYQNFNRSDLAKRVIERAYTGTYVESVILARLMLDITSLLRPEDRPQITTVLEESQKRYRMALLDMRSIYESISSEVNYFGLSPDYIPFPALNQQEQNAFEVLLARTRNKCEIAKERENLALQNNRAFETDTAEFQAELVRLRNTYEGRIGDICGVFEGTDGRVYPAISRYAYLNERAAQLGDPCGLMGNGTVFEAMGQFEMSELHLRQTAVQFDNTLARVDVERSRVSAQCQRIVSLADYVYDQEGDVMDLQRDIAIMRGTIGRVERAIAITSTMASLQKCIVGVTGTDCPSAYAGLAAYLAVSIVGDLAIAGLEAGIAVRENDISQVRRDTAKWQTLSECDSALIESNARTAEMMLSLKEIELEGLRAEYQVRLAVSEIQQQLLTAKRYEQELREAEEQAINLQAARNDPNVRIYRNDAYLNADISFEDAVREAYRSTKVFEYYTSQSYAELEKLFLVRMIQYGDYNLQNYLINLENAFYEFEETYGLPDTRVEVISLRDDILSIPLLDDNRQPYSQNERIDQMRQRLVDSTFRDKNGYLSIPFSTNFSTLSPLTRNHKIYYIEAEIIGSAVGDTVGRVYVRQGGTSVVNGLDNVKDFYRFPERTAVVNPFFNGNRLFTPDVYKNWRLRDLPYINTSWELIFNQKDERSNQDIDLNSITDIRLYVYYTDFTVF